MKLLDHLLRLAGIQEATQIEFYDDDAQQEREQKIKHLIAMAFKRIDLDIAESDWGGPDIYYDEPNGREAIVGLDDNEVSLDKLDALRQTGLAASYVISGNADGLSVMFSVDPGLDDAQLTHPGPQAAPG